MLKDDPRRVMNSRPKIHRLPDLEPNELNASLAEVCGDLYCPSVSQMLTYIHKTLLKMTTKRITVYSNIHVTTR